MAHRVLSFSGARRALGGAALLLALLALTLGANVARGALAEGLAAHEDEAGHVITSLMVRDWLAASGLPHPLAFAQEYYLHYPKVGIGHWPPLYYAVQGTWTFLWGASQTVLVALTSVFAALCAWLLARGAGSRLGLWPGLLAALLFLAFPLVQWFSAGVLLELPVALGCLASAMVLGAWLDAPSARRALGFGLLAAGTALVKGNGLCLAFVPPLALFFSARWDLLRLPSLWLMPLPVLLLAGPWFAFTAAISRQSWAGGQSPSLDYFLEAGPFYLRELALMGGPAVTVLALLGMARALLRRRDDGLCMAWMALLPAVVVFHMIMPSSLEPRHLVLLAAPWAFFALAGARCVAHAVAGSQPRLRAVVWAGLVLASFAPSATLVQRGYFGYREALEGFLADPDLQGAALLVSSDSIGDGLFITAAALGEERGSRVVLRATKSLGRSDWMGHRYEERFPDPDELESWLLSIPVSVVAVDHSLRPREHVAHHDRLAAVMARSPERWRPIGAFDVTRAGRTFPGGLAFYRLAGPVRSPHEPLDAAHLLGQPVRRGAQASCPGGQVAQGLER